MRAAFFEGSRTMTVRDTDTPEPGPGQVRLEVRYCGICGSDLSLFKTGALAGPDVVLGHEVSAVVDLDPSGGWEPGTRVVHYPPGRGCGECVWCREGKFRYCLNPPDRSYGGGYAQYMLARGADLIAVPDAVDDGTAALAEPLGVALRGVTLAEPKPGELAYVSGLGPLGLFAASGLLAEGCRVVGADPNPARRALALELGCAAAFDPTAQDPLGVLLSLDQHGPRVAFECAGIPDSLQQVIDVCGPQGVVGILGIPMASVFLLRLMLKDLRAFSIQGPTMDSMRRALQLVQDRPQTALIVTGTVPLEAIGVAMGGLIDDADGVKVLVAPNA